MQDSLGSVKDDYQGMLDDYNGPFLDDAAVRPMDGYQRGVVSYNLGVLDYDRGVVRYDLNLVRGYYGGTATDARAQASSDLSAAQSQIDALERAVAADPAYVPATTASSANQTRDELLATLASIDARHSSALSKAKEFENKASALYTTAKSKAKSLGAV